MTTATLALEPDFWRLLGRGVWAIILYSVVGLALMTVGFFAIDLTTPGHLRQLVRTGKPNAIVITSAGMISMAIIVVLAVYSSAGRISEGLISSLVFGLVGIAAQIISVRVIEKVAGVDIGAVLQADKLVPEAMLVAAAHFALGLVVAFAIL
jgi:Domain of Unknown Function (DUF350)